ncbi:MAG: DNA polymerase III subunit alpha, partial [Deltaproteobacteria bacterium]|nr:DNA polymerase III subunit alpha [Deltaproteobacteria bacterium]
IEVLPPDINTSAINFTVHGSDIRFGLAAVKNVGTAAIENILSARDSGDHFTSLQDFLARIDSRKVNKKVIESLIKCGALDSLGEDSRAFMFDSLSGEMELAQGAQRDREIGQSSLFDTSSPAMGSSLPGNGNGNGGAVPEWDERELLSFEKETLGFYISSHPLLSYEHEIKTFSNVTTESLKERRQGDEVALACVVTEKRETMTKKGARMAFMRVEDTFGGVEVVVFSDLYTKHIEELSSELPLLLTAKVEKDSQGGRGEGDFAEAEAVKLIALDVMYLSDASKNKIRKTHIEANENVLGIEVFNAIKDIITDNPGPSPIFLHILFDDGREVVQGFSEELTVEPSIEVVDKLKDLIKGAEIRFT